MSGIVEFDVGGRIVKTSTATLSQHPSSRLWQIVLAKEQAHINFAEMEILSNMA